MSEIEERIWNEMHKEFGVCSACGHPHCSDKAASVLPDQIDTTTMLSILSRVLGDKK